MPRNCGRGLATRDAAGARSVSGRGRRHRVFHRRNECQHVGRLARDAFGHLFQAASRRAGGSQGLGRSRAARAARSSSLCCHRRQRPLRLALGTVGSTARHSGHGADYSAGRRSRLDLAASGHAFSWSRRDAGHLPCVGTHRGDGQEGLRRKHRSHPTMDRIDPECVAFGRLADGATTLASGMVANQEAIASQDVAVLGQLLGQTPLAP